MSSTDWLNFSVAMVVIGTAIRLFRTHRIERAIAEQRKHLAEDLARLTGTPVKGDPMGAFQVSGTFHGIEMSLENLVPVKLPGPSNEQRACAVIELRAAIPDLLACSMCDVDTLMGPMPSVPRTLTGDTAFDSAYATFITPLLGESTAGFRTSQAADALAWAKPEVLRQCIAFGMHWLRVEGGRCQLTMPASVPESAHQILTIAANLARAAAGRPLVEMPAALPHDQRIAKLEPLWLLIVLAAGLGTVASLPISLLFLPPDGREVLMTMIVCSAALYFGGVMFSFVKWTRRSRRGEQ